MKYKYNWDLNNYFYENLEDEKFNSDLNEVLEDLKNFIKKYKNNVRNFTQAKQLLELYKQDEEISIKLNKVFHFVFYMNSLDTQDGKIVKKIMELENMFVDIQNELLFLDEEFKKMGRRKILEFAKMKELSEFKFYLKDKANNLKYLLSQKEEKLINEQQVLDSQIENLYNEFYNGMSFYIDGKEYTQEEVRSMRSSKYPEKREKAYDSLHKEYDKKHSKTIYSNIYSNFVKSWLLNIKLRKYKTVMEPRNLSENLDNKVVDMLLSEVIEHYDLFQRYVKLKAKLLKIDLPLPSQDLFAPIIESNSKFTKDEAIEKHLEVMRNFDDDFYNYSVDLLDKGRVDFDPKLGKRGGAFASYSKGQESFVLLNFTGKLNDISTLSHEFGHAIHGHLSQKLPEQVYDSPLSLAETASIFNEMLLSEYLVSDDTLSKNDKIFLLESKLSEVFSTIFRQIQYVDFERNVHERMQKGEQFDHEDFCKLWRETQLKMSKDTIKYKTQAEKENTWSMIPHIFHTPFYCYSYAFGNILTFSLYGQYKKEGKKFIKNYKEILKSGGSTPPKELLAKYGIKIDGKEFYKNAFNQISTMLNELEELTK